MLSCLPVDGYTLVINHKLHPKLHLFKCDSFVLNNFIALRFMIVKRMMELKMVKMIKKRDSIVILRDANIHVYLKNHFYCISKLISLIQHVKSVERHWPKQTNRFRSDLNFSETF